MSGQASIPEPNRLYVIGDIHGRADLLGRMIEAVNTDAKGREADSLTVTLGDYVDRGPDTRGVIERLAHNPFTTRYVALKGNHESLLENFLRDPEVGTHWRYLGGPETLQSYGVRLPGLPAARDYEQASEQFSAALPPPHAQFLASLRLSLSFERYFLCHAGIRPGVAFERQSEEDLLWIREEFLTSRENFGKLVIHGHTPAEEPEVRPNRINVDTGAFATGRLTCVVLEDGSHRFITAR
jgi:serine/threonine protein phosphatase 1